MRIDEIQEAIKLAIAEAYERGFSDGKQAVVKSFIDTAQSLSATTDSAPNVATRTESSEFDELLVPKAEAKTAIKRAPRGLTETVLKQVLSAVIGLPMEDVQRKAVEFDGRVSPKTVYNELYRRSQLYKKDSKGNWRLRREGEVDDEQLTWTDAPEEREEQGALTAH